MTPTLAALDWSMLFSFESLIQLFTLTLLEVVLGIDNIVFIAIMADRLPPEQRKKARQAGLALALITRLILLTGLAALMQYAIKPLFEIPFFQFTQADGTKAAMALNGRDIVLLLGGFFLIAKATKEIHHAIDHTEDPNKPKAATKFWPTVGMILLIDIVFSLDSVITAIGMLPPEKLPLMITAVVLAIVVMLAFAGHISEFINRHPSMKMLALSFLLLIGFILVLDGMHQHVPKGYIYFAMAFSFAVETLNLIMRKKKPAPHA